MSSFTGPEVVLGPESKAADIAYSEMFALEFLQVLRQNFAAALQHAGDRADQARR